MEYMNLVWYQQNQLLLSSTAAGIDGTAPTALYFGDCILCMPKRPQGTLGFSYHRQKAGHDMQAQDPHMVKAETITTPFSIRLCTHT